MSATITITGNLGRDAVKRFTPSGQAVVNFDLASNRHYTNGAGEKVNETTWYRCTLWGNFAEAMYPYLKKSRTVRVDGRLIPDPKTGGPRIWQGEKGPGASFEVSCQSVELLGHCDHTEEASAPTGQHEPDADIPF